jgi:hypothetical protein
MRGVGKNQLKITAPLPLGLIQLSAKPFTLYIPFKICINNVHLVQPKRLPERKIFSVFLVFFMYICEENHPSPPSKKNKRHTILEKVALITVVAGLK